MEAEGASQEVLPHHAQQPLCTTRLPYRQGRRLTAVKVYTIFNESNHLLVFGVPSLNLRQEARALFSKFGRVLHFSVSKEHPAESFTETYHVAFEKIQSARIAKKMLDTKNFYGGSLHVCYAPEFESVSETREKLLQRQRDVLFRLRNLQKESQEKKYVEMNIEVPLVENKSKLLNMGEINTIDGENNVLNNKRKKSCTNIAIEKKFKPCFVSNETEISANKDGYNSDSNVCNSSKDNRNIEADNNVEIIDFISTEKEVITNINDSLNYNNFGNEIIRRVPEKPVNRIKFNLGNKS